MEDRYFQFEEFKTFLVAFQKQIQVAVICTLKHAGPRIVLPRLHLGSNCLP